MLAELCKSEDLIAFTDEIYEHIVFDGIKHVPLASQPGMRSRCVSISGLSKTFSITGWRVGYLTARQLHWSASRSRTISCMSAPPRRCS